MIQHELCVLVSLGCAAACSNQPGPEVSGPAVLRGPWAAGDSVSLGSLETTSEASTSTSLVSGAGGQGGPAGAGVPTAPPQGCRLWSPHTSSPRPPCHKAMRPCTSSLSLEAPGPLNSHVPARTAPLGWLRPIGPQLCSSRQCPHVQCPPHLTSLC